ncbi:copper homeostasis protein CutC [Mucilaginibacter paludis]|uniref:PF03932 family protein CutC n=1 Tax=Mucilaginibacter paludis DSM 18603 TaxID=714943 RepID=H1YDG7_9SPHI|nr:copper homeostasis protein CutC [Mucilaginibacter paludis]EHQ30176.1 Copper homeostasis protein cutC [Mucilaginibacter paludis DSM 18603]
MITIEVCANSITSALAAQQGGASRVELCENLREGGTTPSYGQIILARKLLNIQLYVLIRPRAGDFFYNDMEFELMKLDVKTCIEAGCDGIVIGILNGDGSIDTGRCSILTGMAQTAGLGVTFHRAFDMCRDQTEALEEMITMGCERVLTSGGKSTAIEGASNIARLVQQAAGRIKIMPGSGINEYNIVHLVQYTGAAEFHTSAKTKVNSKMVYRNSKILFGPDGEEYTLQQTDADRVKKIIELANQAIKTN